MLTALLILSLTLNAAALLYVVRVHDRLDQMATWLDDLEEIHGDTCAMLCTVRMQRDDARHQLDALGGLRERSRESVRWN